MERLIFFVFLYVIYFVVSSLFGKKKLAGRPSQGKQNLPAKDPQAALEQYVTKLEKSLKQPQRKQVISFSQQPEPHFSRESLLEQAEQAEEAFSSTDAELDLALQSSSSPPPLPELHLPEPEPSRPVKKGSPPGHSLLSLDKRHGYIRAIIMSEVLGPPVSKRNQQFKPPSNS